MKNRFTMLLLFAAAFMFTTPALAAPPEEDAKADTKTDDAATDDAKAEEKADDAKTEEKADETSGDGGDEAKGDDPAEGIQSDEEAVEAAQDLLGAIQSKQWALALGLGLSLLVFGLRKAKVLAKVPAKALPWVTAVLGVVGYVAVALTTEGANITDAVLGGAMTGAAAVGLWEMLLKHFLGGKKSEGGSGG